MSVNLVKPRLVCDSTSKDGANHFSTYGLSESLSSNSGGGGSMEQRLAILEAAVSRIEKQLSETSSTMNAVDKNTSVILERLGNLKDSLSQKPSTDAVEKRISEAKATQIIWTIATVLSVVSIASGIVIKLLHS
ncbi:hypothetical protein [Klebsiella variicola]|uniref:hypothetical protein n=1 Tax=Klebsiella variicola TaxID=244366 RepID=UPI002B054175|nr:hypothetical protein [Klebsiella variicola]